MTQTIDTKVPDREAVSDKAVLSENTPFIQSPLLYTKADGTQAFVHDTFRDYFSAKYFAEEINEGRVSVRDAYVDYWTCVKDKIFFDLGSSSDKDVRDLLPEWKGTIEFLIKMLEEDKQLELASALCENYFNKGFLNYKPYDYDYLVNFGWTAKCLVESGLIKDESLCSRMKGAEKKLRELDWPEYDEDKWIYFRQRKRLLGVLESLFEEVENELYSKENDTDN